MNFGWIGCHREGLPALTGLLDAGAPVRAIITPTPEVAGRRSAAADFAPVADRYGVPMFRVNSINDEQSVALLQSLGLDVAFVIGWNEILRPPALRTARLGMVGAHASMLPHNRGSAPINWSLIRGEERTGNTLIWLSEGVDAGDIIDQTPFEITPYDTCASLYDRVAESNRDMLLRLLPRLLAGERPGVRQSVLDEPVLPRRRPADGRIDWAQPSEAVYNFVRALTRPYPGAYGWLGGRRWIVWNAALLPDAGVPVAEPGRVLGPVVSPTEAACGQLVACGTGAVILLELEGDNGETLLGRRLSDTGSQPGIWTDG